MHAVDDLMHAFDNSTQERQKKVYVTFAQILHSDRAKKKQPLTTGQRQLPKSFSFFTV